MGNWLVVGKSWGGSVNVEPAVTNMLQIYKCRSWATPLCILETCKFKATIFYDLAFFGLSKICTHAPLFSQNCNNCLQSSYLTHADTCFSKLAGYAPGPGMPEFQQRMPAREVPRYQTKKIKESSSRQKKPNSVGKGIPWSREKKI